MVEMPGLYEKTLLIGKMNHRLVEISILIEISAI